MPGLILAIQDVIKVFQRYSEKDCSRNKLNSEELNLLIQNEFADVIKNPKDPNTISSLLAILDENNDGEVDFNEFCDLLCKVLKAYYKVVYEKEETCEQKDEQKKNVETTSQTTSQKPDEPPNYYQKPLLQKCEKTQSTYHDQKGACAVQRTGGEKNQICTQTEAKDSTRSQSHDYSQGKDQTSQQDQKESQSQGKEQTSPVDTTVSQSHSESSKDQVQGTTSSQPTSFDQGKDQTSQSTTTSSQSSSCDQGKDQTSQSTTTNSQSTSCDQGKDQTSQSTTPNSQSTSCDQGKDQTSQSTTTSSQSTSCDQGKDQTSQSTTTNSQSTSCDQGKDQTSHSQSTTTGSQSTSYDQGKDQTSQSTTTGSQSQGKEQVMMAENTTTADQPGQTQEAQNFYRQPLYIPPAQSFGLEASSQPPSYSQSQQDSTPTCQETQKEPHQSQQNKFYQHQQTFSIDKKNP